MSKIIPDATKLAAKRGFVRTTYQGFAATLSGGIAANAILSVVNGEVDVTTLVVTGTVAVVSPFIAGAASYFSIASKGIPEDYQAS